MKRTQGFTLIELMIVIAIVAILVALAVPAYKDYTIRAKVSECINGAAVAKLQVSEYRETVGIYPADPTAAGTLSPAGESHYCDGFNYYGTDGAFYVEVLETVIDSTLTGGAIEPELIATDNNQGGVDWRCAQGNTIDEYIKYLPSTCRGT